MEEFVGELWDNFITRIAEHSSDKKNAVELKDVRRILGIYFRALGGDTSLNISGSSASYHHARRSFFQKIAGSGMKVELSWQDSEDLRLPNKINYFQDKALNLDLYFWLTGLATIKITSSHNWIIQNQLATLALLDRFPGLQDRYSKLVGAAIALRKSPDSLPTEEAEIEIAIRQALEIPGSVTQPIDINKPFQPIILWPHPTPPNIVTKKNKKEEGDEEHVENDSGKSEVVENKRKHAAERVDAEDKKNGLLLMFRAESIFSWAEFINVNRPHDDEDDLENAKSALEDMDKLAITRKGKLKASRLKFDLDLPPESEEEYTLKDGILLPEWNWKKQALVPNHCSLKEICSDTNSTTELPAGLRPVASKLKRQFESLISLRYWQRSQQDGDELDLDAWIRLKSDITRNALSAEEGLYQAHIVKERDLACLLLADLSISTDAYISNDLKIIDVIRNSLFLFSEALSSTGDRFALYGFSSLKRSLIRFHQLKAFNEKYEAKIKGRINEIKAGYYTRMGAAIRHASSILASQNNSQKLLLILTDGKPNDLDEYEGRYGIEDTRKAILEAKQMGLRPFCVTIDKDANEYLPHLFGVNGYVLVSKPEELPEKLVHLYALLTH